MPDRGTPHEDAPAAPCAFGRLHHLPALLESLCAVVRGTHLAALLMRELQLDDVGRIARLVEQR
jgi:hypothetical protein